jgi:hypothetical protein
MILMATIHFAAALTWEKKTKIIVRPCDDSCILPSCS